MAKELRVLSFADRPARIHLYILREGQVDIVYQR